MIKRIFNKLLITSKALTHYLIHGPTAEQKARKHLFSIPMNKGDIAIDCGANVGEITKRLCNSGATVYAFEPNPHAFKILEENFANTPNVKCLQQAVGGENGTVNLYLHENSGEDEIYWSTGSSLLDFKGNVLNDKYVAVDMIDLSEFILSLNQTVRILKMDIEGAECEVMPKLIESGAISNVEQTFVETHDHKIPELLEKTNVIRKMIKTRNLSNINLDWT